MIERMQQILDYIDDNTRISLGIFIDAVAAIVIIQVVVFLILRLFGVQSRIYDKIFKKMKIWTPIVLVITLQIIIQFIVIFIRTEEVHKTSLKDINGVEYYEQQENLYNESGCEDYFYDYDGSIIESQNGSQMSNWISCEPGQKLTRNGTATNVVCYFDADKNFIRRVDSYGLSTIEVPNDERIAYVRMAVQLSPDRVIVYGDKIQNSDINGNYYMIPELKIQDKNLINNHQTLESPNGDKWKIMVNNDGSLYTENVQDIIEASDLPTDFPSYEMTGHSIKSDDYLVVMNRFNAAGYQYEFEMSSSGEIKKYLKIPVGAFNFRKLQYNDGTIRYAYQQIDPVDGECYIQNTNGGLLYTHVVLMDENFNTLNDNIHPLKYGQITDGNQRCENHEYKIIDDNHYILTTLTFETVDNIPGYEGQNIRVVNNIIQEQKNGKVVMQWESIDHPELYAAQAFDNYEDYKEDLIDDVVYDDYCHINAIAIDPNTGDFLISCRSIGLMKIDRETGDIQWMMSRKHNDIKGLTTEQIGYLQHDVRYTDDGSFTVFDNSGGEDMTQRILRFWIDEDTLELKNYEEFTTSYKQNQMGQAKLIDDETDTYLVQFGGGIDFGFEEINFSTGEVNTKFKFSGNEELYRIFSGVETVPNIE